MRRVRLCFWHLFRHTPLNQPINQAAERAAAQHCKVAWELYLDWKREHRELWWRGAAKRLRAEKCGRFPPQPWQLRQWRKGEGARLGKMRRERPRFVAWAGKKLLRQRCYKRVALRHRVLDRLAARLMGY